MAWSFARSQAASQPEGRCSASYPGCLAGNGCPPAPGLVPGSRSVRRSDGFEPLFWAVPVPLAGRDCEPVWQAATATRAEGWSAGEGAGACAPQIRVRVKRDVARRLRARADPPGGWRVPAWSGAMARARHGRQGVDRSRKPSMTAHAGAPTSAGATHLPRGRKALRVGQCAHPVNPPRAYRRAGARAAAAVPAAPSPRP